MVGVFIYLSCITEDHRLGGRHICFLIVLEAGKSKINLLANLGLGMSSLPGLQIATFSLCPYMAQVGSGGSRGVFSYKIFLGCTVLEALAYCVPTLPDEVIKPLFPSPPQLYLWISVWHSYAESQDFGNSMSHLFSLLGLTIKNLFLLKKRKKVFLRHLFL